MLETPSSSNPSCRKIFSQEITTRERESSKFTDLLNMDTTSIDFLTGSSENNIGIDMSTEDLKTSQMQDEDT